MKTKSNPIKVLSLPSRHPYVVKFNVSGIKFVNPNTDFFEQKNFSSKFIDVNFPPLSYDLVHVHFSFDKMPLNKFKRLLEYFVSNHKPIIWTCHSKESQRIKNFKNGQYQKLLFKYSNQIISPTNGCLKWLKDHFGKHSNPIKIIPLGFMASPKEVSKILHSAKKDRNLFTYLIGDFRQNKEFLLSITYFLNCEKLKNAKLLLIFKPIGLKNKNVETRKELIMFRKIIKNHRIKIISLPHIKHDIIIRAFLRSHAIILPYKWGTHSGQIELAKDCGCHVVVSNVGYYKEQWNKINLWKINNKNIFPQPLSYMNALVRASQLKSLKPAGQIRQQEFKRILNEHIKLYKKSLRIQKNKI